MHRLITKLPDFSPDLMVFSEMSEIYDWSLLDLNIPEIHKKTLGENIKIAIVDSGQSEHSETKNNTVDAKDFSGSGSPIDKRGHSTMVSGLIAAAKDDEGIIGVAPKSQLYFAKAVDDSGTGKPSAMVQSVYWAIEKQVDIISISAGMFFDFKPLYQAILDAYKKNILIIAAAGNTGTKNENIAYPARYKEVIGVAAYDKQHKAAPFSSRGIDVFCALPGVDIYSCWLNNQYCRAQGTSFSAPIMTGICALILSHHRNTPNDETPCDTPAQMMEHLKKYSKKLDDDPKAVGFGTIDLEKMFE